MAAKVLNAVLVTIGVIVVALLALIAVYVIGYSLFAIFARVGMGTGTATGVGAGIAIIVAFVVLAAFLRSRRAAAARVERQHPRHHRAA